MNDTVNDSTTPSGAGTLLRQSREAAGAHIAALAVALKVPVRQLEALEADRLDLLPDATFARALAASVCRHLRIDPQPILDLMPQAGPRAMKVPEDLQPYRGAGASSASWRDRLGGRPALWVAVLLLLAALLLFALPALQSLWGGAAPEAVPAAAPAPAAPSAAPAPGADPGTVLENVNPVLVPSVPASAASLATGTGAPAGLPAPAPAPVAPSRQ